jgi:uncharacterized membrane protein YphA (DoxX/SURF4 family)
MGGGESMNIVLWVLQALLALAFFAHGCLLLFPPAEMLQQMSDIPTWFRFFLGAAEVLAAIGLTLPGLTRVAPWLIAWAAAGLMIVMVSATVLHTSRGETGAAITTAALLVVLTFVAYMRWKVLPIQPRAAAPQRAGAA